MEVGRRQRKNLCTDRHQIKPVIFSRRDAEAQRSFRKTIDSPSNTVLHKGFTKIEQVAELKSRKPKVGLYLFSVGCYYSFHRFQLDNDFSAHNQVGAKTFVEAEFLITNRDLPLHLQPSPSQLKNRETIS